MLSFLNLNKNLFALIFFIIFLISGIFIFPNYGISIDEDNTRINGFASLKYIFEIISPELLKNSSKFDDIPTLHNFREQGIGAIFDLPMAWVEYFFNINDTRNYYLLRHFFNFLFFFTSVVFFFVIVKKRYNSNSFGLLGAFFLILSPRIFADSFYNNKDIVFLSLFIICLYYSLVFLEKPNVKNTVVFSLTSAFCIDIRILGIILPSLIIFFYFLKYFDFTYKKIYVLKPLFLYFILTPAFIIIFWPYLWENPFENFISVFKSLSSFDEYVYNFYFGKYILAQNIPWHYPLVWMGITIPIFYIILFWIGFLSISKEFYTNLNKIELGTRNSFWKNNNEMLDLIFFTTFLVPLLIVIILNSTLYDGWRHLYFLYPSFLLISMSGLYRVRIKFFKNKLNYFYIICVLLTVPTLYWMIKNHPYQYVFFNSIAGKNFNTKFEMDYWGVANVKALEYIAKNEKNIVKVASLGTTDLVLSKKFLEKKYRHKLKISPEVDDSNYIINNYRNWLGKYNEIPEKYQIFYEIKIDGIPINTIYKKNN